MVLKRWNPNLSWQEVDFFVSIFWVQVHRLPSLWLSENNLKKIGSLVGEVLEVDFIGDGGGFWKKFSRIQMCVWIPLILLKIENNKKIIKKLLFTRGLLFICLLALFMSHEQCKKRWSLKIKIKIK